MISPLRQAEILEHTQWCLLGQFAGDSLGSLVEFRAPDDIQREHPNGVPELAGSISDFLPLPELLASFAGRTWKNWARVDSCCTLLSKNAFSSNSDLGYLRKRE